MKQRLILGLLAMAFILAGCGGDHDPTSPMATRQALKGPQQPADDTSGSEIVAPTYPAGTVAIAAIGDSITYGYGSRVGGYPALLEQKLRAAGHNVIIYNEGVPGEISPETDERLLDVIANVDIVLIMIGTNDVINHRGDYSSIAVIERMLDKAIISKTVPIISTVTPAASNSDYAWANDRIQWLNTEITAAAAKRAKSVHLIDNYNAILSGGGDALFVDRLHFNDQGYAVIADQWFHCLITNKILEKFKKK